MAARVERGRFDSISQISFSCQLRVISSIGKATSMTGWANSASMVLVDILVPDLLDLLLGVAEEVTVLGTGRLMGKIDPGWGSFLT